MLLNRAITQILSFILGNLRKCEEPLINYSKLMCFFGIMILGTHFEWTNRGSLWSLDWGCRFIPVPNFVRAGISRNRFDNIWTYIWFSKQHRKIPDRISAKDHYWMLCDDFVAFINKHCKQYITPGLEQCIDESILYWYGLGGDSINCGLPRYLAIERKLENRCKIHNFCTNNAAASTC